MHDIEPSRYMVSNGYKVLFLKACSGLYKVLYSVFLFWHSIVHVLDEYIVD